jgi:MscS family membrane protein
MLSLSIGSMTGWNVPPVLAEDNRPQPTLKDLIGGKGKDEQPTKQADADSLQPGALEDPLGREVPRSSVRGFLAAVDNRDFARAAEYLDLRNLPTEVTPEQGQKLARQLKIVLDRVLWIDLELLSTSVEGDRTDNLPIVRDRIGRITTDGGKVYDVLLQRVPRGDGAYIWKFSGATVGDIPELYKEYGYGPFERAFPSWLFDVSLLGIHLWMWLLAIVLGLVLYPIAILITRSAIYALSYFNSDLAQNITRFFAGPIQLLLWTVLGRYAIHAIGPSVAVRAVGQARTFQVVALAWLLLRVVDFAAHRASSNLDRKGLIGALVLLKPLAQLLKAIAVTAAVLLWLDNIGFKVTTRCARFAEVAGKHLRGLHTFCRPTGQGRRLLPVRRQDGDCGRDRAPGHPYPYVGTQRHHNRQCRIRRHASR